MGDRVSDERLEALRLVAKFGNITNIALHEVVSMSEELLHHRERARRLWETMGRTYSDAELLAILDSPAGGTTDG